MDATQPQWATLDGGPRDGAQVVVAYGTQTPPDRYRIPVPASAMTPYAAGNREPGLADLADLTVRAAVYHQVYTDGWPSRDDRGNLRYRYAGQEQM